MHLSRYTHLILAILLIMSVVVMVHIPRTATATPKFGTISSDETWTGNIEIIENLTITMNTTVDVMPGCTVSVSANCNVDVFGNLCVHGAAMNRVTFKNVLNGSYPGIRYIGDLSGGYIKNTTIRDADVGLELNHTDHILMENMNISNPGNAGIILKSSSNCTLSSNVIYHSGGRGIELDSCRDIRMIGNTLIGSNDEGIVMEPGSNRCTIRDNTITESKLEGISVYDCISALLKDNDLLRCGEDGNTSGMYIDGSMTSLSLKDNTVSYSGGDGVSIITTTSTGAGNRDGPIISGNLLDNNGNCGLYISGVTGATILSNTLRYNTVAVSLSGTSSALLRENTLSHSYGSGVEIVNSEHTIMEDCSISYSTTNGVNITSSSNIDVRNGSITTSDIGIEMDIDSDDITIDNVDISITDAEGIVSLGAGASISNCTLGDTIGSAIYLESCEWAEIYNNTITDAGGSGIDIVSCPGMDSWNNIIRRPGSSGIALYDSSLDAWDERMLECDDKDLSLTGGSHLEAHSCHVLHDNLLVDHTSSLICYYRLSAQTTDPGDIPIDANFAISNSSNNHDFGMMSSLEDIELWGYSRAGDLRDFSSAEYLLSGYTDTFQGQNTVNMSMDDQDIVMKLHNRLMDLGLPDNFSMDEDTTAILNLTERVSGEGALDLWVESFGNLSIKVPDPHTLEMKITTVNENWSGDENIHVHISDSYGKEIIHTISIIVDPVNDAPRIATEIPDLYATEGDADVTLDLTGHGLDPDLELEGDTLSWWVMPEDGIFDVVGNNVSELLTLKLQDPDLYGDLPLTVYLEDSHGERAEQTLQLHITAVDDAPVLDDPGDRAITRGVVSYVDMSPFVHDVDTDLEELVLLSSSKYVSIDEDLLMSLDYPLDTTMTSDMVTLSLSDGNSTAYSEFQVTIGDNTIYTISGSVYWGAGGPKSGNASGVTVELTHVGGSAEVMSATTVTNSSGMFTLSVDSPGSYILLAVPPPELQADVGNAGGAERDGYLSSQRMVEMSAVTEDQVLVLSYYKVGDELPSFFDIDGKVVYDGGPDVGNAQGCTIRVFIGTDTTHPVLAFTDTNGEFEFLDLAKGSYRIVVEPPRDLDWQDGARSGYRLNETTIDLANNENITIRLEYYDASATSADGGGGNVASNNVWLAVLLILLLLVIAIIVAIIVIRRRRSGSGEGTRTDPYAGVKTGDSALEAEVEDGDIFEKHKTGRKEDSGGQPHTITIDTDGPQLQRMGAVAVTNPPRQHEPATASTPVPLETELPEESVSLEEMEPLPELAPIDQDIAMGQEYTATGIAAGASPVPDMNTLALPPARIVSDESESDLGSSIDELLIINSDGMLMDHYARTQSSEIDKDVLSGMLTAVQSFVKDSFGSMNSTLKRVEMQDFTVLIEPGKYITVVGITRDKDNRELNDHLLRMMREINSEMGHVFRDWNGDMESIRGIDAYIQKLLEGGYE